MSRQVYTPSMLASALKHYEERATWTRLRVRIKTASSASMRNIVTFESSKKDTEGRPLVYQTMETWCSCPGFNYHGGVCSHWLAVRMEIEQARRIAGRRRPEPTPHPDLAEVF